MLNGRGDLQFSEIVKIALGNRANTIIEEWLCRESGQLPCGADGAPRNPIHRFYLRWTNGRPAPTTLLAVVNRLDAAEFNPATHMVEGAEIRFVYTGAGAANANEEYIRLIVEFVLSPRTRSQFREMARLSIQATSNHAAASMYLNWIRQLTGTFRIRISTNSSTTWDFQEFRYRAGGLQAVPLERDFAVGAVRIYCCLDRNSSVGDKVNDMAGDILASRFTLPSGLQAITSTVGGSDPVLRLSGFGGNQDDLRFSLSVNSCRGCHGGETQAGFHHVGFRTGSTPSPISRFLGGNFGSVNGPSVTTWTPTLSTEDCDAMPIAGRPFNDLLRRHVFLHAVTRLRLDGDWTRVFNDHSLVATAR